MKKTVIIFFIFISFFIIQNVNAQNNGSTKNETTEYKTIFKNSNNKTKISGFGAINIDLGSVSNNTSLNLGLDIAVLMNRSFYFGIYARTLLSFPEYNFDYYNSDTNINLAVSSRGIFAHGGMIIGANFFPNKPVHFGLSTKIGGGAFGIIENDGKYHNYDRNRNYYNNNPWSMAPLLVITPQLDIEMNINYWFKFRLSAGYQWVSNSSLNYQYLENGNIIDKTLISSSDLSSPYLSLGLVFGWFK